MIGKLHTDKPIEKAMKEIKGWLDKINVNGLGVNIRYDAKQNIALLQFNYQGKNYEFRSQKQKNCRLNMWAISRVIEYKVRAHLMDIEPFTKSMMAYVMLEASAEATNKGYQENSGKQETDNEAYAVLGISPLSSNLELLIHFKKLAKSWHPDMAGSEEAKEVFNKKFSEINEAMNKIKLERGL